MREGERDFAGSEIPIQEVAEGVAVGQAQRRIGGRERDTGSGAGERELGLGVKDGVGIQHVAGGRLVTDVEVAEVGGGRSGDGQGVGRVACAAIGETDLASEQGNGDRPAGVGAEREITEGEGVAGLAEQHRRLGAVEEDGVAGSRIDAEFRAEVVNAVEVKRLAGGEAEGDVEEAAFVERGQADQPAVGRTRDTAGRTLQGEGLRRGAAGIAANAGVDHGAGVNFHQHRAGARNLELAGVHVIAVDPLAQRGGVEAAHVGVDRTHVQRMQRRAVDAIAAERDLRVGGKTGNRVGGGRGIDLDRRRQRQVDITLACRRQYARIHYLGDSACRRIAGEGPGLVGISQRNALRAVGRKVARHTEAVGVALADALRGDVGHQRNRAGAVLGRVLAGVGQREFGAQVGDGRGVDAEAGRNVVEVDRQPLCVRQAGGTGGRHRMRVGLERPAAGYELDGHRIVGAGVGRVRTGGPVAEREAGVVRCVQAHRRLSAIELDGSQSRPAQAELGRQVGDRSQVKLVAAYIDRPADVDKPAAQQRADVDLAPGTR